MKLGKILIYTTVLVSILTSTVFGATTVEQSNLTGLWYKSTLGTVVQFDRTTHTLDTTYNSLFSIDSNFGNPHTNLPTPITITWSSSKPGLIKYVNGTGIFDNIYQDNGSMNVIGATASDGVGFEGWWFRCNKNVNGSVFVTKTYQGVSQTIEIKLINPITSITMPSNMNLFR